MSKAKLQIGYSPLTGNVYLGKVNPDKPFEWVGNKEDITNDFIEILLIKFPANFEYIIKVGGEPKYSLTVKEL